MSIRAVTLESIRSMDPKTVSLKDIHCGIVHEARVLQYARGPHPPPQLEHWRNAVTLFTEYLGPIILASQQAAAAVAAHKSSNAANDNSGTSQKTDIKDAKDVGKEWLSQNTRQLTTHEVVLAQWSISALVRYAPSPDESNRIYAFFLQQCQYPVRNDETINECLISLIYVYAQTRDDRELQAKGLDLITIALERGLGLETYAPRAKKKGYQQHQQKEGILASVSKPILILLGLRIAPDGRTLVPSVAHPSSPRHFQQYAVKQQQQEQIQSEAQQTSLGQSEPPLRPEQTSLPLLTSMDTRRVRSGRIGRQLQNQKRFDSNTSQQTFGTSDMAQNSLQENKGREAAVEQRKKDKGKNKSATDSPYKASTIMDEIDQYAYYASTSDGFTATECSGHGERAANADADLKGSFTSYSGRNRPGLRTIAFVPASTNASLRATVELPSNANEANDEPQTPDPSASISKEPAANAISESVTQNLVADIEKLRLNTV
ncbi:hypothetical protein EDD11_003572 [Mortierella claussenii]|nr:hypothetical protein EDD11_003572 [Mortierella claussenii]